jgi:hypothetical protein
MWINRIVESACTRLGRTYDAVYDEDDFGCDLKSYIASKKIDFLSYGNADIEFVRELGNQRGFHVIRDPRDIAVSAYFSHLRSHSTEDWPELIEYREKLNSVPKAEGLTMEIENRKQEFRHLSTWDYGQDGILEVRFEELVVHTYEQFLNIFDHLGILDESDYRWTHRARGLAVELLDFIIPSSASRLTRPLKPEKLSGAEVAVTVWRNRFQARTSGRKQGQESASSHYRKGLPGDWRNHFEPEHKRFFKEKYPGLLTYLGYEKSEDW